MENSNRASLFNCDMGGEKFRIRSSKLFPYSVRPSKQTQSFPYTYLNFFFVAFCIEEIIIES